MADFTSKATWLQPQDIKDAYLLIRSMPFYFEWNNKA